jgi:electron transfer flavoprotein beta subunit
VRCDDAVHIVVEVPELHDPSQTAELLLAAIRRLEEPELVLAGRQAGDWDHGQVGHLVAERLRWPMLGLVWQVEQDDGRLIVWRSGPSGGEQFAVRPPAVLTVTSHSSLRLRVGNVMDLMAANRKPSPPDAGGARLDPRSLRLPGAWSSPTSGYPRSSDTAS